MRLKGAESSRRARTVTHILGSRSRARAPTRSGTPGFAIHWLHRTEQRQRLVSWSSESRPLPEQIGLGEIDDFIGTSAENRFQHEEREALGLLQRDTRRYREFLTCDVNFDNGRTVVFQSLRDHRLDLIWRSHCQSQST